VKSVDYEGEMVAKHLKKADYDGGLALIAEGS
jgi:hypothetical protein